MLREILMFTAEGNAKLKFTASAEIARLWLDFVHPLRSRRVHWRVRSRFHYVYGSGLPGDMPNGQTKCGWQNFQDATLTPRNSYFLLPNGQRVTMWEMAANYVLDHAPEGGQLLTHLRCHQGPWIVPASEKEWFASCLQSVGTWYVRTAEPIAAMANLARQTTGDMLIVPAIGPHYCRNLYELPIAEGVWRPEQKLAWSGDFEACDSISEAWSSLSPKLAHELMMTTARLVSCGWHPLQELSAATVSEKRYTKYSLEQVLHDIRQR